MTVPKAERLENVKKLQQQLNIPETNVFCDFNYRGCRWNSKRAFTYPTAKSHILVLADDSKVCDDFLIIVNKIINKHPNTIISLFDYYDMPQFDTPYLNVKNKQITGQAIIIPKTMINTIFTYKYNSFFNTTNDDTHIVLSAKHFGLPVMLITPNIVNSQAFVSTINNDGGITSKSFKQDVSDVDWDSDKVVDVYCH